MDVLVSTLIVVAFSYLGWKWLNGHMPDEKQQKGTKGRVIILKFRGKSTAIQTGTELWVRFAFMALGPAAILGLSVAYAEVVPLKVMFLLFVLPAYIAMLVLGILFPAWGKRALVGFIAGLFATFIYDLARIPLMFAFGLKDPISHIGNMLVGDDQVGGLGHPYWWIGYLWRFFGNGAGMGIVYAMMPRQMFTLKGGSIYGEIVGTGMIALLFFFPISQYHLFILNVLTLVLGIIGHQAYGITLGWIMRRSKVVDSFPTNKVELKPTVWWAK